MNKYANLKVGIVTLVGLIAMAVLIMIVGSQDFLFSRTYHLKMFLVTADGISDGTMVSLGGIKVGTVKEFELVERNGVNGVDLTMNLLEKYRNKITNSSIASINTSGMLGDKYIELSIGKNGETALADNSYITVTPVMDLAGMLGTFKEKLGSIGSAFESFKGLADDIRQGNGTAGKLLTDGKLYDNLCATSANASSFVASLNSGKGTLGKVMRDDSLYYSVKSTADNLNAFTQELKNGKGTLSKLMTNDSLYNNINALSLRINGVLGKLDNKDSDVGKLLNGSEMYNQVNKLIIDINALIEDINKNPGKYVKVSVF